MRHVIAFAFVLLMAATASADPALGGGRGLFRVQDARVEEDGALVFANRWMFNHTDLGENVTMYRGPLYGFEMDYAPTPMTEVFGSLVGVIDLRTNPSSFFYDWQGQILGAKLSIPFVPVLKLAGSVHHVMQKSDHTLPAFLDGLQAPQSQWRVVAALRMWELHKTLPTLMFNYGKSFEKGGQSFVGTGLEMASDAVDLFIEASSDAAVGGGFFKSPARARITPGFRIKIPYFHLNGGIEIGLTDSTPSHEAIAGFSFVSPFPKPPPKPWGRLAGRVQDARSGLPLAANISITQPFRRTMETDPKTGVFLMQRAPTGVIVVEASKEGYIPEAAPLVIADKGFANYTFNLKPLVPYGTVAGRIYDTYSGKPLEAAVGFTSTGIAPAVSNPVTGFFRADNVPAGLVNVVIQKDGFFPEERVAEVEDGGVTKLNVGMASLDMKGVFKGRTVDMKTGHPVAAVISFTQKERPSIAPDTATGTFSTELPVGSFEVKVDAPGYVSQTSAFTVNKGDTIDRVFEMVSKGMVLTLKGVYFEFGKATLRTESYPALMEAAQIMKDNPDIQVEIQGHTDSLGSAALNLRLSDKRAYSVMNWLVQYGGIDPKRLTAKGYGKTQPIASNETEEGRQLNRRVDFVILK